MLLSIGQPAHPRMEGASNQVRNHTCRSAVANRVLLTNTFEPPHPTRKCQYLMLTKSNSSLMDQLSSHEQVCNCSTQCHLPTPRARGSARRFCMRLMTGQHHYCGVFQTFSTLPITSISPGLTCISLHTFPHDQSRGFVCPVTTTTPV